MLCAYVGGVSPGCGELPRLRSSNEPRLAAPSGGVDAPKRLGPGIDDAERPCCESDVALPREEVASVRGVAGLELDRCINAERPDPTPKYPLGPLTVGESAEGETTLNGSPGVPMGVGGMVKMLNPSLGADV